MPLRPKHSLPPTLIAADCRLVPLSPGKFDKAALYFDNNAGGNGPK
ncbi:hypothetical protein KGO5_02309 [Sinorhizobium sp. KGO-5]|nr:hypothetical protein KGO5_02309 [Sinorhizobium sp. KGO-5]